MNWYLKCLRQYADFSGRARRKEYWMFILFNSIIAFVFGFIIGFLGLPDACVYIYSLAVLIPGIAVAVRRLHDVGKSGWMYFINLIPIVGQIWLIILFCQDSQPDEKQWGTNPKEDEIYNP